MIAWAVNKINRVEKKIEQVEQKLVNGVNVTKLFDMMDGIRSNPVISKFNFRAKGLRVVITK
jgi:hypothetical protein